MNKISENLTLIAQIGVLLTFIVAVANLIFNLYNSKKTTFINSVTTSRIKYIQEIRTHIADFCSTAISWIDNNEDKEKTSDLSQKANQLKFIINLYLNPEDEYWDKRMIQFIDSIIMNSNEWKKYYNNFLKDHESADKLKYEGFEKKVFSEINKLVIITQYLLKLEWEGVKLESKKGLLTEIEKKEIYNKYVGLYESYLSKQ